MNKPVPDEPDFMAFCDPLPRPTPRESAWELLATYARWLADHAERLATLPPEQLAPHFVENDDPDDDLPILVDELGILTERANGVQHGVAACRRLAWQQLADRGLKHKEIAAMWGVKRQTVSNALKRGS